ncbi:MAG: type II toxin-antitoxin system RelE/ParE family toxin, partial [Burkholderiales bacterium]|nr:type II toxin-antitoxin system RelE/ParE family toxin [Burkholderiales bacterium]
MLKIYKTKHFNKWQSKSSEFEDSSLIQAIHEMQDGLFDAELGGNLYKKRIARHGAGKSSGYRTIIATKLKDRWFFIFGFAKNEKDNISNNELKALQRFGELLLNFTDAEIKKAITEKHIVEVN